MIQPQILIPISGRSQFFPAEEFYFPKPLIEIAGVPMIELVVRQLRAAFPAATFAFVIDQEDARAFSLEGTLRLIAGEDARIVERLGPTSGALCSCLLAVDVLTPGRPLLISNSDQILTGDLACDVGAMAAEGADAGVLTFKSVHPRWSYVITDPAGVVQQAFEKRVVSDQAIAGLYHYRSASIFVEAAQRAMLNDAHVGGDFFISASLNEIILKNGFVVSRSIDPSDYHSFYAPSRINAFERTPLAARLRSGAISTPPLNVVIPAAGEGSRFAKAGWKAPKPFIDVAGKPMLARVTENVVPDGARATLLLRREHITDQADRVKQIARPEIEIVPVDALTEGTACTVLLARTSFGDDEPMMVANSDQIVDFDVSDFVQDCVGRDLDGSILVFRDPTRDPKWSFARLGPDGLVAEVAEKKPISDLATVGIYLFRRGRSFVDAAVDMIARNERVNGEFYTCPVYNHMIRTGARVGVYEVPMDAMHGIGTPDDLGAYLGRIGAGPSVDRPDPV